jgi:hypothetical protein
MRWPLPHGTHRPGNVLTSFSTDRYTRQVPPGGPQTAVVPEHFVVCSRYVSMAWLALSAPVARLGDVDPSVAAARTPESITIRRDLELERVIGCAEANVSAQADQAHPQVWLPGPHGRSRRPRRAGPATAQGTPCSHRRGREQVHAESLGDSLARWPVWHARWRARDGGLAFTARTAWNDDFGCGVAATCARHARGGGPLPMVHWSFAICPMSPIHLATGMASSPVARVAAPCSATG